MSTDAVLLERGVLGFGEAIALLGRHGPGAREIREPSALGARVAWAGDNHWADTVVVPVEGPAWSPVDDDLPHCVWSLDETIPLRRRASGLAMPVMGLVLDGPGPTDRDAAAVTDVGLDELGVLNDLAYSQEVLAPLLSALPVGTGHAAGVRDPDGRLVSAALALDVEDDASVQWVATHPAHRRRGHARRVLDRLLADARDRGRRTATLQSSPDGYALYEQLGFRTVATLYPHLTS